MSVRPSSKDTEAGIRSLRLQLIPLLPFFFFSLAFRLCSLISLRFFLLRNSLITESNGKGAKVEREHVQDERVRTEKGRIKEQVHSAFASWSWSYKMANGRPNVARIDQLAPAPIGQCGRVVPTTLVFFPRTRLQALVLLQPNFFFIHSNRNSVHLRLA